MPLHSIVGFDSDTVQIVTFRQRGAAVERAVTIPLSDFESFLLQDRSDDYRIILDAPDAQCEIITIPPVESKLVSRISSIELRRLYPEYPPFTAFYRSIDAVAQDGKTIRRVACCMVPNDHLTSVLDPFIRHNKSVSLITTLPTALAQLVETAPETRDQTLLCAYDSGDHKCIFLLEKGCVTMVRNVPSAGAGWRELDLQNVTMTLDYCFQTLRVRPTKTIALDSGPVPPPLTSFTPEGIESVLQNLRQEYLPHLAIMTCMGGIKTDLRPESYLTALTHQNLLRKGVWVFSLGSVAAALLALLSFFSILSLQNELTAARQREQTLPSLLSSFHAVQRERSSVEPIVAVMNALQSTPTLPELLAALPECTQGNVRVTSLIASKTGDTISLSLSGTIPEKNLATTQSSFEAILARLSKLQGFTASSQQFDLTSQTFTIGLKNKP